MADTSIRQRNLLSVVALLFIAALFVAVVVLSGNLFKTTRADLTEDRLYTLSPGSLQVIQEIDEPITLRFYYSSRLGREIPQIGVYAQRVRDLLEEYAALSEGRIRLELHDPEPFSDAEDRAVGYGLLGVPVDQTGEMVYFGLAGTNPTDQREIIRFFDQQRERFLEYDLTRLVHTLANPDRPKVALISALEVSGSMYSRRVPDAPDDSWTIYEQLSQQFEVEELPQRTEEIPEDIDLLVLIHPKALTEEAFYAIDQFVMRGGRLLAFVDPYSEADAARPRPGGPDADMEASSSINQLIEPWGVIVPNDEAIGDLAHARRVRVPAEAESRVAAIDYPLWLGYDRNRLDPDDPITSELSNLNIASPGHIVTLDDAKVSVTPLIRTSDQGGKANIHLVREGSRNLVRVTNEFQPDGSYVLAARLSGRVPSAFPDGPPKPPALRAAERRLEQAETDEERAEQQATIDELLPEWEERNAAHIAESREPLNAILVADVDMLADGLWVQSQDFFGQRITVPVAHNGNFFVNAADHLTGSDALIGLRSRGVFQRPFTMVQDIKRDAERRFRAKEQELLERLRTTERRMRELQREDPGQAQVVLTDEQRIEIEQFREEALRVRRELRDVQHALRKDVEALHNMVMVANIGAVPVIVALVAIVLALVRRRNRRRFHAGSN